MDGKKAVVELQQLDLLEAKIARAVETIQGLRRERDQLRSRIHEAQEATGRLQAEVHALEKDRQGDREHMAELEILREERLAVRGRVSRMLETMAALEDPGSPAGAGH